MKDPEHYESVTIDPVLKDVDRVQYSKSDLPIFWAPSNRSSKHWMLDQNGGLAENGFTDDWRQVRIGPVEKFGKSIEIGESVRRPFNLH